mgnify:CR=1 FL=1
MSMAMTLYAAINVFCMAILLLLGIMNAKFPTSRDMKRNDLLTTVFLTAMVFFAFDLAYVFVDGNTELPIALDYLVNGAYYSLSGICAFTWLYYSENKLGLGFFNNKGVVAAFVFPVIALVVLSITPYWVHDGIFYIDDAFHYHRGSIYMLQPIITFGYIIIACLRCLASGLRETTRFGRTRDLTLAAFGLAPLSMGILQVLVPGTPLLCIGITISLIYVYIRLQAEQQLEQRAVIDGLTSDYESVILVSLGTGKVTDFRMNELSKEVQEIYGNKRLFPQRVMNFADTIVADEERDYYFEKMSTHHIMRELARRNEYITNIHLKTESGLALYQIKIVRTADYRDSLSVIIGLRNIDEETRQEIRQRELLEDARNRAESANAAKSTFLFNMSHDIRTPMNAIMGFTGMAQRHIDDTEQVKDYLSKIELSSNHLLKLINDVLDMARIESGKVEIVPVPASIHGCGNAILTMAGEMAKEHGIELTVEYHDIEDEYIYGDILHLDQIMINIVSNAIKYTKSGGKVKVSLRQKKYRKLGYGAYEIKVADTGIGMSEEFLKHIFDSFERERTSTISGIEGAGLGMSIVKRLVDLMDGSIEIDSEVDVGTTVTINLLFHLRDRDDGVEDRENHTSPLVIDLRDRRVLVAEDNELNREIIKDILEDEGIIVELAVDGLEAVDKIKHSEPGDFDFVLMDIQMPNLDGYEATKLIRGLDCKPLAEIPIIAMTANAFEEDKKKALSVGMNAHLAKPVNIPKLMDTITTFLKKS